MTNTPAHYTRLRMANKCIIIHCQVRILAKIQYSIDIFVFGGEKNNNNNNVFDISIHIDDEKEQNQRKK